MKKLAMVVAVVTLAAACANESASLEIENLATRSPSRRRTEWSLSAGWSR